MATQPTKRGNSRVFTIKFGAGPTHTPEYHGWAMAGALSLSLGDVTRIEAPSRYVRNQYEVIGITRGAEENATLPITFIYPTDKSEILALALLRCALDVQVHISPCADPSNFDSGWHDGKVLVFEDAHITTYGTTELGALQSSDEGKVDEEIEISAQRFYEIAPMDYSERLAGTIAAQVVDVVVCDSVGCGDCENPSDGCQKVFALVAPAGSSPGVLPTIVYSDDGLASAGQSVIDTLSIGEDGDGMACVGDNLVVVSAATGSLHYAPIEDILAGDETWTEVSTGFAGGGAPAAIVSKGPGDTWIVGAGGYIYKSTNPANGVTVQADGSALASNLLAVAAYDLEILAAVGENNAVLFSENGGESWAVLNGPDGVGTPDLTTVAFRTEREIWVGTDDGRLFYTTDKGQTWTESAFYGSGAGVVEDIVWASKTVGYLSHTTATPEGRILRSITGGNSWFVVPEGSDLMPANDEFTALAVCQGDVNIVFAGGLADDGADGILVKGE